MKKFMSGVAIGLVVAVVAVGALHAGEGDDMDEYMKQYMEAIAPGPHHENLAKRAGEWNAVVRSFPGPGVEPMESEGKCTYEVVLGGRFVTQQMEGSIMGMPFLGMGFSGFDKTRGKHTMYWIDSMGTAAVYAEGMCSDQCMKEEYSFTTMDPISGQETDVKAVTVVKSDDEHVFEWYMTLPNGELFKSMEIVYTRAE